MQHRIPVLREDREIPRRNRLTRPAYLIGTDYRRWIGVGHVDLNPRNGWFKPQPRPQLGRFSGMGIKQNLLFNLVFQMSQYTLSIRLLKNFLDDGFG